MKTLAGRLADLAIYVVVRVCVCVVQATRIETCEMFCRWLAWLAADVLKVRRKVVDANLSQAFPDWSAARRQQVARQMWEHLCLLICEMVHLPRKVHETNWREFVTLKGTEPQARAMLSTRPTVVLSGHFGNFEAGGIFTGLFGHTTYTVARPLDNPYLDRWFNRLRQARGQHMLPKLGVAKQIGILLESGAKLMLLGDQDGGPKGCLIEFFGKRCSYHKAIGVFTLTSDAPMVIGYCRRLDRPMKFEVGVCDVYDPRATDSPLAGTRQVIQWYNDELEKMIRLAPEQYWWVHRRWKTAELAKRKRRTKPAPTTDATTEAA